MTTFQLPDIYIEGVLLTDDETRVVEMALHSLGFLMKADKTFGRATLPGVKLDIALQRLLQLYNGDIDAASTGT